MKVREGFHMSSWPQKDGSQIQAEATRGPGFWNVDVCRATRATGREKLASLIFHADDVTDGEEALQNGLRAWRQRDKHRDGS